MAMCELAAKPADRYSDGTYNEPYIDTCMQSKGYVEDERLSSSNGGKCKDISDSYEQPGCYRPDNELEKWLAGLE